MFQPKEQVAGGGITLQILVALGMLWTATYESLLTYIGFTLSLSTAASVVGLMVLRRREGSLLRVPGWTWVPGAFVCVVLAMNVLALQHRPAASLAGLATLALGWFDWAIQQRIRKTARLAAPDHPPL